MQKEGVKGADLVNRLTEDPSKLLGTILVGNNVINIGASALATAIAIELFQSKGVGIATAVMTILILVFGTFYK
jgi:putative hemolysin